MTIDLGVLAEREGYNLKSIIDNIIFHPGTFNLKLVIVPFGDLDEEFFNLLMRYQFSHSPQQEGTDIAIWPQPIYYDDLTGVLRGKNIKFQDHVFTIGKVRTDVPGIPELVEEIQTVHFLHAPYDGVKSDEQRAEYCADLKAAIEPFDVDLIVMTNYMKFLAPNIIRAFDGRIINEHSSVLPYDKGWRPEQKAIQRNNPHGNGYTVHLANEDMDEGPVLFQQRVPIEGHDEGSLRLAIIRAQSRYITQVLNWYGLSLVPDSGVETRIVGHEEALVAEGRKLDMHYLEEKDRDKYHRVLFKHNGVFTTLERMLDIPEIAPYEQIEMDREYVFELVGPSQTTMRVYMEILGMHEERSPNKRELEGTRMSELTKIPDHPERYGGEPTRLRRIKLRDPTGTIGGILEELQIPYHTTDFPVDVGAPRRPGIMPAQYEKFTI